MQPPTGGVDKQEGWIPPLVRFVPFREGIVHIVLIDDNEEILDTLSEILRGAGHAVTSCQTGLGALLRIAAQRPDVVLLDLKLDDISGFDLFRALHADPEFASIPVLFVSGVILDQEVLRARIDDPEARLLLKPVSAEELIREIQMAADRARRKRRAA